MPTKKNKLAEYLDELFSASQPVFAISEMFKITKGIINKNSGDYDYKTMPVLSGGSLRLVAARMGKKAIILTFVAKDDVLSQENIRPKNVFEIPMGHENTEKLTGLNTYLDESIQLYTNEIAADFVSVEETTPAPVVYKNQYGTW